LMEDKTQRGVFIDGTEEKGATKVLRHLRAKEGLLKYLVDDEKNELDTAWKLFTTSYTKRAKEEYCGFRPWTDAANDPSKRGKYEWMTYGEFGDIAVQFGCGLRALGVADQSNIGLFAVNRPEWYQAHLGNLSQSYRSTALYDTLGPDARTCSRHPWASTSPRRRWRECTGRQGLRARFGFTETVSSRLWWRWWCRTHKPWWLG